MELEPFLDTPALLMNGRERWICVADLHLGLEVELRRAGFNIPSQMPKMLASLVSLSKHAKRLLILGDLKHRIHSVAHREDKEIKEVFGKLSEVYTEIAISGGNHDGGISSVMPESVRAYSAPGGRLEDIGFLHGHVWPSKDAMAGRKIVMAHIHPSVLLVDTLGARTNMKCWVKARLHREKVMERYDNCPDELVVVPAFNPLMTGTPINMKEGVRLGPLFKNGVVDESSVAAYLLDGTNLGNVPRVEPRPRSRSRS